MLFEKLRLHFTGSAPNINATACIERPKNTPLNTPNSPEETPVSTEGIPRFTPAEMQRRHHAAEALCAEHGVDALLIFGHSGSRRHYQADIHYLSQVAPFHESYMCVQPQRTPTLWITHDNHFASARETATVDDVRRASRTAHVELIGELRARGLQGARIGLVGPFFYQELDAVRAALPEASWKDLSLPYKRMRMRKSAEELAFQRKAAAGTDAVMEVLRQAIRPGIEERELLEISEAVAWKSGCTPNFLYLNSTPMAASESCVPNQHISRRKLQAGDVINTELTVSYGMYSAQLLRPFFLGEPTPEYARMYSVLKRVHDNMAAAMRAGVSLGALYELTLEFREAGYTTVDGILHGFGVDILPPGMGPKFDPPAPGVVLERDTTVVLQPNPTSPDEKMGLQLGQMGLITDDGYVPMHASPAEVTYCY
jgi:Xaa-Pro aminopeptidase